MLAESFFCVSGYKSAIRKRNPGLTGTRIKRPEASP
jgi:hypothetical protein